MDFKSVMERMLGQSMHKPIALKKFFEDYKSILEADVIPISDRDIKLAMGLTHKAGRFKALRQKCNLLLLDQPDDAPIVKFIPGQSEYKRCQLVDVPIRKHNLRSFRVFVATKDTSSRNPFRRSNEIYKIAPLLTSEEDNDELGENQCEFYNELLITIRIYRPTRATHQGRTLENPVFAEEFQCLGCNLLTELRDKISCICNKYHFYDISNTPDAPLPEKRTDPGFFFITDTFYNDNRNPENADYSHDLLEWAKKTECFRNINFKVAKMEETRFIDLTVSLGFAQLYQHHGNCEHLFTFSQVELLTPSNTYDRIVSRDMYPRLHTFGVYNNRLCNMCGVVHCVYAVCNSNRQLHDPAYLCSKCFRNFHYIDGKKVGQFRAYRLQDFGPDFNQVNRQGVEETNSNEDGVSSAMEENPGSTLTDKVPENSEMLIHEEERIVETEGEDHEKIDYRVLYNEKELMVIKETR